MADLIWCEDICSPSTLAVKVFQIHSCGAREGPLTPYCTGPRDFKEEVRHYCSFSALTPPRNPKGDKM